jgi:hypothetical protein
MFRHLINAIFRLYMKILVKQLYKTYSCGTHPLTTLDATHTATLGINQPTRLAHSLVLHDGPTALHEVQFWSHADCTIYTVKQLRSCASDIHLLYSLAETKGSSKFHCMSVQYDKYIYYNQHYAHD